MRECPKLLVIMTFNDKEFSAYLNDTSSIFLFEYHIHNGYFICRRLLK